ncbi:hypothetical protein J4206_05650 [Candidatus Woesearchaeota archaeon]|nr:hypothetical protein [Candidatus Woesearchaeota archaeon]
MKFNNTSLFIFNKRVGKRGISPLIATVLLVAFAVALGAVVMNWAKGVEEAETSGGESVASSVQGSDASGCIIPAPVPQDPLKLVMIKYLRGEITKADYFTQSQGFK